MNKDQKIKLSNELEEKLESLVTQFADEHLDGKPVLLGTGLYFRIKELLLHDIKQIRRFFP